MLITPKDNRKRYLVDNMYRFVNTPRVDRQGMLTIKSNHAHFYLNYSKTLSASTNVSKMQKIGDSISNTLGLSKR